MSGNLREQVDAFESGEAGLQAALTALEQRGLPPHDDNWGNGSVGSGCQVSDPDNAPDCTRLDTVLTDWRGNGVAIEGVAIDSFGGDQLTGVARQPRVVVEKRYLPPLDFEAAVQQRGIHFFTVTALGTGAAGQSERILQTTIAKVYIW